MTPIRIEQHGDDVLLWIKAVPGASRDSIAGALGDRLKLRIMAPPEGGKANKAICKLIAHTLNAKPRNITIEHGASNPEKTIRIANANADDIRSAIEHT